MTNKISVRIRLPKKAKVFLLEDDQNRIDWFKTKIPSIIVSSTALEAMDILTKQEFDFVFLDHDLGLLDYAGYSSTGDGRQVARYLSGRGWIGDNVVIHSWNPAGAAAMKDCLEGAVAIPFGRFELEFY